MYSSAFRLFNYA